jgi:hypothetical protein
MRNLIISAAVREKLEVKHKGVSKAEIVQCFENRCGIYVVDDREDHRTDPATLWFVAETNAQRALKIVLMYIDGNVHIKSAYEPNQDEIDLYEYKGK